MHRALKRATVPVQYSVFLVRTTPVRFEWLMTELRGLIDPGADDLRAYPLTAHSVVESLGAPLWPDGVLWAEAPDTRAFHFAAAPE